MNQRDWDKLLEEAETLCRIYVGKNAESEPWGDTLKRLIALDKQVKKIRRQQAKAGAA